MKPEEALQQAEQLAKLLKDYKDVQLDTKKLGFKCEHRKILNVHEDRGVVELICIPCERVVTFKLEALSRLLPQQDQPLPGN